MRGAWSSFFSIEQNSLPKFAMNSTGKIVLCLAVIFCFVQGLSARPQYDENFVENVKYNLLRKCQGLQQNFDKDIANLSYKLNKNSDKLLRKAVKPGSAECVESAKLQAEETLEEKREEIYSCVSELRDSLESSVSPDAGFAEILAFRSDFKNKLNACKNNGKLELKSIQNGFSAAGKSCLV